MPLDTTFAPAQVDIAGGLQGLQEAYQKRRAQSAIQALMSAKTPQEQQAGIAALMSADPKTGTAYLQMLKSQQLTPGEIIAHQDRQALLDERQREADRRFAGAQETAYVKGLASDRKMKAAQLQAKAEAHGRLQTSDMQFDNFKQTAKELLDDPALDYSVGPYANKFNRATARFINPPVQDWWNKFDTLQSMAKQAVTNLMKNEKGQTGFGRILLQEWNNFGQTIAPLHLTNDPKQMRQALKTLIGFIDKSKQITGNKFNEEFGDSSTPEVDVQPKEQQGSTLPKTAPPSAGNVPVQGAATVAQHQTPEQTKSFLDSAAPGTSGTLHLSDGTSVKAQKRADGHWYDNSGKRVH